ncbi:MOSC domain-containing protein [Streptacidiphilus sp. PB12-B1b]|uniref:MOSC domain-containing protein n=1 Tax=Streptacidiphilus sp. PB12-B1b TaxID=2705012 RepID=UPI0015F8B549|nr:MOSC N-terminal beta barrel domain-containing protein [Streptacidiphilus sp. PB12-B1b]QMU76301.1 MOSC domain-containing protein [Streptacidiphilus sp. PB12-B1b]
MRVTDLLVYPVKSLAPVVVPEAAVEPWGLEHDRRWMLVGADGEMVSQRQDPRLGQLRATPGIAGRPGSLLVEAPDGQSLEIEAPVGEPRPVTMFGDPMETVEAAQEASAWFSKLLDADLRLVYLDDAARRPTEHLVSLADGYPLQLASTASLDDLNRLIAGDHPDDPVRGAPVPMGRFRPNVVVEGAGAWAETGWLRLRIGAVEFRVAEQCGRCVMTTLDPATGDRRGPEPLKALGRHRKFGRTLGFGMLLVPVGELGTIRVGDRVTVLEQGPLPEPDRRAG